MKKFLFTSPLAEKILPFLKKFEDHIDVVFSIDDYTLNVEGSEITFVQLNEWRMYALGVYDCLRSKE